jgi:hypothetical protein
MFCALGNVMLPAKEIMKPRSSPHRAWATVPVKQCKIPPNPLDVQRSRIRRRQSSHAFSLFSEGRQWMMIGSLAARANSICRTKTVFCTSRGE